MLQLEKVKGSVFKIWQHLMVRKSIACLLMSHLTSHRPSTSCDVSVRSPDPEQIHLLQHDMWWHNMVDRQTCSLCKYNENTVVICFQ